MGKGNGVRLLIMRNWPKTVLGYMIYNLVEKPEDWKWWWNNGLKIALSTLAIILMLLLLGKP